MYIIYISYIIIKSFDFFVVESSYCNRGIIIKVRVGLKYLFLFLNLICLFYKYCRDMDLGRVRCNRCNYIKNKNVKFM